MEKIISKLQKQQGKRKVGEGPGQLMITTSPTPLPPTRPIIEILDTHQHQEFYIVDELSE